MFENVIRILEAAALKEPPEVRREIVYAIRMLGLVEKAEKPVPKAPQALSGASVATGPAGATISPEMKPEPAPGAGLKDPRAV